MLQTPNRMPVYSCTTVKRVLLQAPYLQKGLLALLQSAENICKLIHVTHFPFPSVFVHGKLLHLNLHCWDCNPESLLKYCCMFQAQRQRD